MSAGTDCWTTEAGETQVELPMFPANFFGLGSDEIAAGEIIPLEGEPLPAETVIANCGCPTEVEFEMIWLDPHGTAVASDDAHKVTKKTGDPTTDVDTCVRRLDSADLSGTGPQQVFIQLIELSLKSSQPLNVPFNNNSFTKPFDLFVEESGPQSEGMMTFTPTDSSPSVSGDMVLDSLPVMFQIKFRDAEDPSTIIQSDVFALKFTNGTGSFEMLPVSEMIPLLNLWGWIVLALALLMAGVILWMRQQRKTAV